MKDEVASPAPPRLAVRGLGKSFPGVRALNDVTLELHAGEVLAVIGENGAGKSTLMKIVAGVQSQDEGTIEVDGAPERIDTVRRAGALGITLIHQELILCDNLTVGAWMYLGREPRRGPFIASGTIEKEARRHLDRLGVDVTPDTPMSTLSIGQQQLVEIARALSVGARVVIMDEPTSALSQEEARTLFGVIRELQAGGVSIIYISHRLSEVEEVADRVVVLRDGERAGELGRDEIDHDRMVSLMIGRDVSRFYHRKKSTPGNVRFEVRGLRTRRYPDHCADFSLRAGEIVGIAGLVGAGRSELLRAVCGVDAPAGGDVRIDGRPLRRADVGAAVAAGVALVPEDRKIQGVVLESTILENIALPNLRALARAGFVNHAAERRMADESVESLGIRPPDPGRLAGDLSGGNQQKVVLAKWLARDLEMLVLDEPTRGIDIGAKEEIYALMEDMAGRGLSILFASSEMEEVIGLSDRILVMHEGSVTGELTREDATEERIMQLATGRRAGDVA